MMGSFIPQKIDSMTFFIDHSTQNFSLIINYLKPDNCEQTNNNY